MTAEDVPAVQAGLRRRFLTPRFPQVRAVGIGTARAGGDADPGRGPAVVFYVSAKVTPRLKAQRLPKTVRVGVRRGGRLRYVTLPTDVMDLGGVRPSGVTMVTPDGPGRVALCTGGAVMTWVVAGGVQRVGVVTVGHTCAFPAELGDELAVGVGTGGGILLDKAVVADTMVDAALVRLLQPAALVGSARFLGQQPLPYLTAAAATHDRAAGLSCRVGGDIALRTDAFLDEFFVPGIGLLAGVVRAESSVGGAFAVGNSGAVWAVEVGGVLFPVAIQVATDESLNDQLGYAQVMDGGAFGWARRRLESSPGVEGASVEMFGVI